MIPQPYPSKVVPTLGGGLTYEQSATLMTDPTFRGRCKVSCLKFAQAIMLELPAVKGHNTRMKWAQRTYQMPDTMAQEIQQPVVMDPAVQAAGSEITDTALQAAVENTVEAIM